MHNQWDLKQLLLQRIADQGGWVNTHAHLDRAYTITPDTLPMANAHLHHKWDLVDEIKRQSSVINIYDRMAYAVECQLQQGVTVIGSFIDVDKVMTDKAMKAAQKLKATYPNIIFMNQSLKGVVNPEARKWFDEAAAFVDILGALPAKDRGHEDEHLDIVLSTAKKLGKLVHAHVDQLNTAAETETETLAKKTIAHGMQGKVVAIHGVSIAAHPKAYRGKVYGLMKQAEIGLITCPTAWIDARRSEELAPIHNAIAPIEELVAAGITVALGTDNIADIYKPFTDGDLWTELRFLLETCHYYDLDQLVNITTKNGRKVLGLI